MEEANPAEATPRLTLRKGEKLRHKTLVDALFAEGRSFYEWPLRLVWRPIGEQQLREAFRRDVPDMIAPLQMLITVPKRKRRHAVDRVLMRRRIREAYRLCRMPLRQAVKRSPQIRSLQFAFIYMAPKNVDYQTICRKMQLLLQKVADTLSKE